jgi:hypothetical protein
MRRVGTGAAEGLRMASKGREGTGAAEGLRMVPKRREGTGGASTARVTGEIEGANRSETAASEEVLDSPTEMASELGEETASKGREVGGARTEQGRLETGS